MALPTSSRGISVYTDSTYCLPVTVNLISSSFFNLHCSVLLHNCLIRQGGIMSFLISSPSEMIETLAYSLNLCSLIHKYNLIDSVTNYTVITAVVYNLLFLLASKLHQYLPSLSSSFSVLPSCSSSFCFLFSLGHSLSPSFPFFCVRYWIQGSAQLSVCFVLQTYIHLLPPFNKTFPYK